MLINAPRSCICGNAEVSAIAGTILLIIPIIIRIFIMITIVKGTGTKLVYIITTTIIHIAAAVKILNLSILSLNFPTSGIIIKEDIPPTIKRIGSWWYEIFRLFTAKALPHGIIIKPPSESKAVAKKPMRYCWFLMVCHRWVNAFLSFFNSRCFVTGLSLSITVIHVIVANPTIMIKGDCQPQWFAM